MFRLIIALLLIYLIYKLWQRLSRKSAPMSKRSSRRDLPPGEMVPCAKCETFVLKNEALEKEGKYYCSKSCII